MTDEDMEQNRKDALSVADKCSFAVLSLVTAGNEPYGVALGIVRDGGYIYFHSAKSGKKIECMKHKPFGSFFCTDWQKLRPEDFTLDFRSAVISGSISEVTDESEKIHALRLICLRYAPSNMAAFDSAVKKSLSVTGIWKMKIEKASCIVKGSAK